MLYVASRNVKHGMRRRADKSVVKGKSHTVLGGKMGVYYVAIKLVGVPKRRKQPVRLCREVVLSANVYKSLTTKLVKLLVIT